MINEDKIKSQNPETLIFKKYELGKSIGSGFFGTVFSGLNVLTKEKVAIKIETIKNDSKSILEREAYILFYLRGPGLPEVKSFGKTKSYNILVETLLGRSLYEIYKDCNQIFSLKDVCMIGLQVLERLEYIHSKNYIHRDIKPHNLLVDFRNEGLIYIVDFGLAKKFKSERGNHVKFSINKNISGTLRFCSVNSMRGVEQSRRDDLESLCYLIIYFLKGSLPWQGLNISSKEKRFQTIYKIKKEVKIETLCEGLPKEILDILKYVKNLGFNETPRYDYIKNLFITILDKNGYKYDNIFSWIKEGDNNSKANTIRYNHKSASPFNRLYHKIKNSLENKKRKKKENNNYTLNTIYCENLDNSATITDIRNIKKKDSIKSDDNNIFRNNLFQLNIDNYMHSYNYPLVAYSNKLCKKEQDDSNIKNSHMDIPDKISMIEKTPSNFINIRINDDQALNINENNINKANKTINPSKVMKLHNFIRQEEKEGGVIGKKYDFKENEFFKINHPLYLTNSKDGINNVTSKQIKKRHLKAIKYLNFIDNNMSKEISNKINTAANDNSKLLNSNSILNHKIPKENMNKENMLTITSNLDEKNKYKKIKRINIINSSYYPKFNNNCLLHEMKLTNNKNICKKLKENCHSPKSETKKDIPFKFKYDIYSQKLFNKQSNNHKYNLNNKISMNFINKIIHINNKNFRNSYNNEIKNVNKANHFIKINNNNKDIILKKNNTIEYENEYKSLFNNKSKIKNSRNDRNRIIQSNNSNYDIKDKIKGNHILHQKFIGKSNVIKLKIPSRTIDNSRFKLFNFNQNKKFYKYLGHSVSNYLDSITNSLNFDIKDSFKSHNNSSINRNKDKSNDKIMKNYFVVKNSFNNLYNIEKIKSDFNEVNNTLNKDEKIKKMKHLYYTPFLVRKAIKKIK